jgi:hypothetical protein
LACKSVCNNKRKNFKTIGMPIKKPIQNAMQIVPQITFQFIGFSL